MTDIIPVSDLLPCPFCGDRHSAVIESGERFYVACGSMDCYAALGEIWDRDAMPEHHFETQAEATAAWNARPPSSDKERLIEALREARQQLEYVDGRLPTGTTPAVIARIDALLQDHQS